MRPSLLFQPFFFAFIVLQIPNHAVADGVCDPSGWCRLHFQLRSRPYSTVFIKAVDQYGQFRRVWLRADDYTDGLTVDCGRAMMAERNGTGMYFPAIRGAVSGEIYESVCLGQNLQLGFAQGTGQGTWPQPPIYPQGSGGTMPPPVQQNNSPSPLRLILEQLVK
jgi:hypothetical protein